MSRFIDKLKQASQTETQPMGFRKEKAVAKPRLLLVARLIRADIDKPVGLVAGADAGLLTIKKPVPGIKELKKLIKAVPSIPWGLWLDGISSKGEKQVTEVGCDFLVFPLEMPLEVPDSDEIGKVLVVEALLERDLVRAIDKLPVDALFIAGQQAEGSYLTWHHLMLCRRFADLSNKPLLVLVPLDIAGDGLQLLWEAGVDGVVVEVSPGQPAGGFKKLRQIVDSLTPPSRRKRIKARAIVPQVKEEAAPMIDDDTEEEED